MERIRIDPPRFFTLEGACSQFPTNPAVKTIRFWCNRGVVYHGKTIKLRHIRVGKRVVIPREAIGEFIAATTAAGMRSE